MARNAAEQLSLQLSVERHREHTFLIGPVIQSPSLSFWVRPPVWKNRYSSCCQEKHAAPSSLCLTIQPYTWTCIKLGHWIWTFWQSNAVMTCGIKTFWLFMIKYFGQDLEEAAVWGPYFNRVKNNDKIVDYKNLFELFWSFCDGTSS